MQTLSVPMAYNLRALELKSVSSRIGSELMETELETRSYRQTAWILVVGGIIGIFASIELKFKRFLF